MNFPHDPETNIAIEDGVIYVTQKDGECPHCGNAQIERVSFSIPRAKLVAMELLRLCGDIQEQEGV